MSLGKYLKMLELAPGNPRFSRPLFASRCYSCVLSGRRHLMKEVLGTSKSPATPSANGIIRFGNFEVDPSAGEIRRGGLRIKLGGQPFDVLVTFWG